MVESNNGDERSARIDYMLEVLQRETAAMKTKTADMSGIVMPVLVQPPVPSPQRPMAR